MKKIFVVDDDFDVLLLLNKWFTGKGFYVRTFSESKYLYDALHESLPDVIILDVNLQGENGMDVCRVVKNKFSQSVPVVLFSAVSHTGKEVKDSCADYVMNKSANLHKITNLLSSFAEA